MGFSRMLVGMASPAEPLSRKEQQEQTRQILISVARAVFSQDGYHSASLDRIAREAGFSKGAVYSNFDGKAALFLSVMDANLEMADVENVASFGDSSHPSSTGHDIAEQEGYPLEATQGFALATLEFISTAARDKELAPQLLQRLEEILGRYTAVAQESRSDEENLPAEEVGKLLAALDQGLGLILLAGGSAPNPEIFHAGMQRLLHPAPPADEVESD